MTLDELKTELEKAGYPVEYSHFEDGVPSVPFITYLVTETKNFYADDEVYLSIRHVDVELYTTDKDPDAEAKVEAVLDAIGKTYAAEEEFIESEELFQVVYPIKI